MHEDMLARYICGDCNGNLALTRAIDIKIPRLSPCGNGFAEEGFASVGNM